MQRQLYTLEITKYSLTIFVLSVVLSMSVKAADPHHAQAPGVEEQEGVVEEPGRAQEELSRQFRIGEPGISGVIVDRTITMTGKTFFRQFSLMSLERPVLSNANLAIHERPSARWGSQIWITQGNRVIFEATLPPRLSDIDEYVSIAIEQVEELVIRRTIVDALESDPDLADEEL